VDIGAHARPCWRSWQIDGAAALVYPTYIQRLAEMITKIQKWGNSLGLRIPKGVAQGARVQEGTTVMLAVSNGRLIVSPLESRAYELETLLAGVTRKNLHAAVDTGEAVGRESW
jgi:antitoxin MazE